MKLWPFSRREERSAENPQVALSDPRAYELLFGETAEAAGERVTAETALSVPAVWAAVNFISGTIASLPLNVYRRQGEGRERADRDQVHRMLHDSPNPRWTSYRWRRYSMTQTLLSGRSFTFIERNAAGKPMNLWPLNPAQVIVEEVVEGGTPTLRYTWTSKNGRAAVYSAEEIIDVPFMMAADQVGHVSPVSRLRKTIGLALALESYATRFFQNGGIPPLALHGPITTGAGVDRASKDITEAVKKAREQRRNVLALPMGHELKTIGFEPEKSQMEAARRFQVEEIARMYNLPPTFLQDLTRATFSNTEQQDLHFVKHTLTQWLVGLEQELNLKLFPTFDGNGRRTGARNYYVEFNVDGLLRGDFKSRMEGYSTAIQNAVMKPAEARRKENLPDDPDGDRLFIQGGTVPASQAGNPPSSPGEDGDE